MTRRLVRAVASLGIAGAMSVGAAVLTAAPAEALVYVCYSSVKIYEYQDSPVGDGTVYVPIVSGVETASVVCPNGSSKVGV